MSDEQKPQKRAMPVFLVKPGAMKPADIKRLERKAFVIVAEVSDPDSVRLLDPPIGGAVELSEQARAALKLFRYIRDMGGTNQMTTIYRSDLIAFFVRAITEEPEPPRVQTVKKVGAK